MSNPYTEVSISNYNASPPPDDASTGTDNLLTWAKHKTKLSDPIKTAFETSQTNITAALAKVPFINISAISSNHTQVAGDRGKLYSCTNSPTIDLLAAASAGSGFTFGCQNIGSGTVTIDPNGAETVNGSATLALAPGEGGLFTCDGTAWVGFVASLAEMGVTSTVAELNILDGVTSTAAEINELDASAAAVSGFASGIRESIRDDLNATNYQLDAITQNTWTTIGPTSSGATLTWAQLDNVPSGAVAVKLRVYTSVSGSTNGDNYGSNAYARRNGETTGANSHTMIGTINWYNRSGSAEAHQNVHEVTVPIDGSGIFEVYYNEVGTSPTTSMLLYLNGWLV